MPIIKFFSDEDMKSLYPASGFASTTLAESTLTSVSGWTFDPTMLSQGLKLSSQRNCVESDFIFYEDSKEHPLYYRAAIGNQIFKRVDKPTSSDDNLLYFEVLPELTHSGCVFVGVASEKWCQTASKEGNVDLTKHLPGERVFYWGYQGSMGTDVVDEKTSGSKERKVPHYKNARKITIVPRFVDTLSLVYLYLFTLNTQVLDTKSTTAAYRRVVRFFERLVSSHSQWGRRSSFWRGQNAHCMQCSPCRSILLWSRAVPRVQCQRF